TNRLPDRSTLFPYTTLFRSFDQEKHSIAQKLEIAYQSEKKELALEAAKQEAAFTRKMNSLYLVLIGIGMVALFFIFRAYHFRLRSEEHTSELQSREKLVCRL